MDPRLDTQFVWLSHLVVLAEQGQGTMLPWRVTLGYVDRAVGRLGRRLGVAFLLMGESTDRDGGKSEPYFLIHSLKLSLMR